MVRPKLRLLSIEDNLADARFLQALLGQARPDGFELTHAVTARQGLEAVQNTAFDCVFLDYMLEDESGLDVLRDIRAAGNDVPIIALSGNGNEEVAVQALKLGAQDYLVKGGITCEAVERSMANAMKTIALTRQLAERQQDLADFAHVAAHDLRAPLTSVGMFVDWLGDHLAESMDEQSRDVVSRVLATTERMSHLLDSLLEYAEIGRSQKELVPVHLHEVMELVRTNLESQIKASGATIEVGALPLVRGDQLALTQLFQNIISNALKFKSDQLPHVEVSCIGNHQTCDISISDNGIGISADNIHRIFAPFRRLHDKSDYEGSGIGLATCKRIVEQHDGSIWVTSDLGIGTTFHFSLPIVQITPQSSFALLQEAMV